MDGLRPEDNWEYLKRGFGDDLVLKNEAKSTSEVVFTEEADIIFSSFYEMEETIEDISDDKDLQAEKIREVIDYSEASTSHMHELARTAHEESKMMDEASGEEFDDILQRTVEQDSGTARFDTSYTQYVGPVGEFQELVEEKVDNRGLKARYDPDEDQQYRSSLEIHVLTEKGAEDELYFGTDGEIFYIGSTVSDADKEFDSIENIRDFDHIIDRELNLLSI